MVKASDSDVKKTDDFGTWERSTPSEKAVEDLLTKEELQNLPEQKIIRRRGRPKKRTLSMLITTSEEDQTAGEVHLDIAPILPMVDKNQPIGKANMPKDDEKDAECEEKKKETGGKIDTHSKSGSTFDINDILEQMNCDFVDSDALESGKDGSRVSVCGYEVKEEVAPILEVIFSQFGDLVKDCIFPSITSRARLLENVCNIYKRLETLSFKNIKSQELNSMLEEVNDLQISKVEVGWLSKRLDDIFMARQELEMKQRNLQSTKNRRKRLEEYKEEWKCCNAKLKVLEVKISQDEKALTEEEAEEKKLSQKFSEGKSTLRAMCQIPSLAHGLLGSM